jgi:hypothetical protein
MTELSPDFDLCGWRVASAIALPDLPRWVGDARVPDVTVEIGTVPTFEHAVMTTPMLQIDGEGRARFGINGVADYIVENGRRITIAPQAPIDSPDIRLFLLGSGFGLLCHQRGVLPIHASTVEIDGEAVLLAGPSGAGKSTLAAAFLRRGHAVLSDDVSPLDLSSVEPVILPSLRRIRLWSDSIVDAGWNKQDMERCRAGLEKFSRSIGGETSVKPLTPRAIFHLRRQSDKSDGSRFRRLRGRPAAEEFRRQIYRWRSLVGFAGKAAALTRAAIAASRFPQHFIVERALNYSQLDAVVDDIIATVRAAR